MQAGLTSRSVSFDLLAHWRELDSTGQSRFTPPTHALLAFRQALRELESLPELPDAHDETREGEGEKADIEEQE